MPLLSRIGSAAARGFGLFVGRVVDPFFEYVTLLLHGDGTNGAQNNTFLDSSTNNFTITRNGNTTQGTFTPYGVNWSNYFDGATATSLSLPSNVGFAFGTGAYTIEAWVFLTAYASVQGSVFDSGNASGALDLYITSTGALGLGEYGVGTVFNSSAGAVALNSWNHLAIVRTSTSASSTKLYANGTLVGTGTDSKNWTVTTAPSIGGINLAGYSTAGYISNLRVVKGTAVYTTAFTPSTTPLTAISGTSLLSCQSNRFVDNSTNAFTITRNGTVSIQRFSPFSPFAAYSTSVIGGSGYFDGSDYLNFTDTSNVMDLGGATASFETWIYPTAATCVIATKYGGVASYSITNGIEYTIALVSQQFLMYYNVAGTSGTLADPTTGRALNQWYHIVVATNATTLSLYVNGTRVVTATAGITKPTTRTTVRFGLDSGSTYLTGYLSDVRFIQGTGAYDASQTTITVPTAPVTAVTNTSLLLNYTNAGIYDNAMMNDLETVGDAQVSTSVKKFGSGSMAFDGTGDYLKQPASVNLSFGSGDFTLECWAYFTSVANFPTLTDSRVTSSSTAGFNLGLSTAKVQIYTTSQVLIGATTLSANTWYHIAVTRASGTLKIWLNGVQDATVANSTNWSDTTFLVGATPTPTNYMTGYIDDLRVTKGYARYTSTFTPPTAAFPNQ